LQAVGLLVQLVPGVHATHEPEPLQNWFVPQPDPAGTFPGPSTHVCTPVEHELTPARQTFGFVEHANPAVQVVHEPLLQAKLVPHEVPSGLLLESIHAMVPVLHEFVPFLHRPGFVVQVPPAVHAAHVPALHTWLVPHVVPLVTFPLAPQTAAPVEHEMVPTVQGFPVAHEVPAAHATQVPVPLHTWFEPQLLPAGTLPLPMQTALPVEQLMMPVVHGLPVPHETPAVHALQLPALHTKFVPHVVPLGKSLGESMHVWAPLVHDVMPALHLFGLLAHEDPATHALHRPALHTWLTPHAVPFETLAAVSVQVELPVAHEVVPTLHGLGFAEQLPPEVQAAQVPALQTWLVPHEVPLLTLVDESMHTCVPVEHELIPVLHLFVLVVQAPPATQFPQLPFPLHTNEAPQAVPEGAFGSVSTQINAPVAQSVLPALQTPLGFVVHAVFAVQLMQAPTLLHTWLVPQDAPADVATSSTHTGLPVVQATRPVLHGALGLVAHVAPALHALQVPVTVHTWFVPQLLPGEAFAPSTHTEVPVVHEVVPTLQGLPGFPVQAWFEVQLPHCPPLEHVCPTPHATPASRNTEEFVHTLLPLVQSVFPRAHGFELVVQSTLPTHATQPPFTLHTCPAPQLVPASRDTVGTHWEIPVLQEVAPNLQGWPFTMHGWALKHVSPQPASATQ
jgi:hypothetical protein